MKISFCIPTYNREKFLEPLIKSIAEQKEHSFELEICISDNASTDNTGSKVVEWSEFYSIEIIYHRHTVNIGPDKNYLSAVALGTGDYCWIFGSDDILEHDALSCLEKNIASDSDIYLCDRKEMSIGMDLIKNPHRRWLSCGSKLFELTSNEDRLRFFDYCQSVGGVFSYLSSIVVKRSCWHEIEFHEDYNGTAYAHAYILLGVFNTPHSKLHYIAEPLVLCRGDNDTFEHNGRGKRINIDFNGYMKLANDFYANNQQLMKALQKVLLRERPWLYTVMAMAIYGNDDEKNDLMNHYRKLGYAPLCTRLIYAMKNVIIFSKSNKEIKGVVKSLFYRQ
ncbi:glycosyltransferase family 2 protein [Aeromonas veronii]|uniref:glycosyltransferase family 2 protein n=1 Tax=Aeromonas veronii TaxID=654 RepID=UPI003D1B8473